jgi:hypothetical protein
MTAVIRRAKVVTKDQTIAKQFRSYLEGLKYSVEVKTEVKPTDRFDVDIVVYHVSADAAKAERRSVARPGQKQLQGATGFWLDVLHLVSEHAPAVPILVSVPAGGGAADKALDSGATDVIEGTVTPKVFRRRLEMIEAFQQGSMSRMTTVTGRRKFQPEPRIEASTKQGVLNVPLPGLRSEESGRIDARRVADYLGITLRQLADAMQIKYATLHKTPDAPRVQGWLRPLMRVLELADSAFGNHERVRMWLNRPLYELEDESPLAVLLAGEAGAVETLLDNARSGIPG